MHGWVKIIFCAIDMIKDHFFIMDYDLTYNAFNPRRVSENIQLIKILLKISQFMVMLLDISVQYRPTPCDICV